MSNSKHPNDFLAGTAEAPAVEPSATVFARSVADALLGLEQGLQVLYWRVTGGLDQPDALRLESGIRMCAEANKTIRRALGAELLEPSR